MPETLAVGKLLHPYGKGIKIAVGTATVSDGGSFAVTNAAGSKIMRNIQSVVLTPMSGSLILKAQGSSSGYITVSATPAGTPIPTGGTTAVVASYLVIGGLGSV